MEVGLGMRLGVLGSDLPILGKNVPKNDPVHSFFILLLSCRGLDLNAISQAECLANGGTNFSLDADSDSRLRFT